jgi:hypothetical protein
VHCTLASRSLKKPGAQGVWFGEPSFGTDDPFSAAKHSDAPEFGWK